jgi:hypothetical protein
MGIPAADVFPKREPARNEYEAAIALKGLRRGFPICLNKKVR